MDEITASNLPVVPEEVITNLCRRYTQNHSLYGDDLNITKEKIKVENPNLVGIIDGTISKFDKTYYRNILENTILMYKVLDDATQCLEFFPKNEGFTKSGLPKLNLKVKNHFLELYKSDNTNEKYKAHLEQAYSNLKNQNSRLHLFLETQLKSKKLPENIEKASKEVYTFAYFMLEQAGLALNNKMGFDPSLN